MADFERLGEAVGRVLGFEDGEFAAQYAEMVSAGIERALESNPVAQALESFIQTVMLPWQGANRGPVRPAQCLRAPRSHGLAAFAQGIVGPAAPHCTRVSHEGYRDHTRRPHPPGWPVADQCHPQNLIRTRPKHLHNNKDIAMNQFADYDSEPSSGILIIKPNHDASDMERAIDSWLAAKHRNVVDPDH